MNNKGILPSFNDVFYGLKPDLVTATLKYYIRGINSSEEQHKYIEAIFNGFAVRKKLPELLQHLVTSEILECVTTPSSMFRRNSVQSKVIKYYTDLEFNEIFDTCIFPAISEIVSEDITLTIDPESDKFETSIIKMKELLEGIFLRLFSFKMIPDSFKSFVTYVSNEVNKTSPSLQLISLKNIIFLRSISNYFLRCTEDSYHLVSLKVLSTVFQWIIGDSQITHSVSAVSSPQIYLSSEKQDWKSFLFPFAADIRPRANEWLFTLKNDIPFDKVKFKWASNLKETIDIEESVYKNSNEISEFLDTASASVLAMLKEKKESDVVSQYNEIFQLLQTQITNNSITRIKLLTEISILQEKNKYVVLEERLKEFEEENQQKTEQIHKEENSKTIDLSQEKMIKESKLNITISDQPVKPSNYLTTNVEEEKKIGKKNVLSRVLRSSMREEK
ncbi:hypothetical protein ENUP19_0115G0021 [Entamoeba nuttalli]|uniref:GTPase-activator protein for Ras family GTPase n=2 Tax=Entamoeba nuttalli TaxID=412467 RepID=K2HAD3_ENTNP|nr:GTPase-activator protein for Ras family GTPase [Entamoeba nuttalli P19]EKE39549.1 GTPase-activator protein for Ras family GTPase [Entamoeba nuttalli P19]|eukprot:XP_008858114.1 GTPase-activator protein for Ras family GTPase [Entamoeba nuttalli P19]